MRYFYGNSNPFSFIQTIIAGPAAPSIKPQVKKKTVCDVLDLHPINGYNIFATEIGRKTAHSDSVAVQIHCPECDFANTFWGRKDAREGK